MTSTRVSSLRFNRASICPTDGVTINEILQLVLVGLIGRPEYLLDRQSLELGSGIPEHVEEGLVEVGLFAFEQHYDALCSRFDQGLVFVLGFSQFPFGLPALLFNVEALVSIEEE